MIFKIINIPIMFIKGLISKYTMIKITSGNTRTIYLSEKYAFKVPRLSGYNDLYGLVGSILKGWTDNRTEYTLYKKEPNKKYLAPILSSWFFSFIIVMPRLKPVTDEDFKVISEQHELQRDVFEYVIYELEQAKLGRNDKGELFVLSYSVR